MTAVHTSSDRAGDAVAGDAERRAATWLQAWDACGMHRTGTAGDEAGADWLAHEAASLGATVSVETFALDRLDPVAAHVDIGDVRLPGVPVFDAPATGPDGIAGVLGPAGSTAAIGVAALSPQAVYRGEYRALRRAATHDALVIVCQGEQSGLGLLNAEQFREPYGAPAIQVSGEHRDAVMAAVERGATARVVASNTRRPVHARNIVVALPGSDPSRPPLVVMTPRSSWWQSTAERGGGLVCWLESLRALLCDAPARGVVLTANSGHELGHLGLDDFVARRAGWDQAGGAIWLHYGANIGAARGRLSLLSNDAALREAMAEALADAGHAPPMMGAPTQVPSGETRDIHRAGGRYVTLVGTNPLFHMPDDRWPHAVDAPAVARIAAGCARLVRVLTRR